MQDYSFDELQEMQEKALRRVQHMQARSRELIQNNAEEKKAAVRFSSSDCCTPKKEKMAEEAQKPGRISMPLNLPEGKDLVYPSFQSYFAPHNKKEQEKKAKETKSNLIDTILNEPDEALLFVLLLVLKANGQNEALLLALLYVML